LRERRRRGRIPGGEGRYERRVDDFVGEAGEGGESDS